MSDPRRAAPSLLACLLALPAGSAVAWDAATHLAIAKAAFVISPAAEARAGSAYSDTLWKGVQSADPLDPQCLQHAALTGFREISTQAEQSFRALQSGKLTPYVRTQTLARLIHFVSDSAMPQALYSPGTLMPDNFFDHTRFVIFREPQGLALPLAASLREKGAAARLSMDGPANHSAAFRRAANLVAEALLLLPPAPGEQPADAVGPAVFPVSRVDDGRAGKPSDYYYYHSETGNPREVRDRSSQAAASMSATLSKPLPDQGGLVVVEWNVTPTERANLVRAVLFNNEPKCATKVVLTQGGWKQEVPVTLGPFAVRTVELQVPADAAGPVSGAWKAFACDPPFGPEMGVSTAKRLIVPIVDRAPIFDYDTRLIDLYASLDPKVRSGPAEGGVEALAQGLKIGAQPTPRGAVITQDDGGPYFGRASVGRYLRLTGLATSWESCPGRARVYGAVRNISPYRLTKLRARLVIMDRWRETEETREQIQSMDPSTLEPAEEAQIVVSFPCDWASYQGRYYAPVLNDVAGETEQTVPPTPPR